MQKINKFTGKAQKMWCSIPQELQQSILNDVWCMHCFKMTAMLHVDGTVKSGKLVLSGVCAACGSKVERVIEEMAAYETL